MRVRCGPPDAPQRFASKKRDDSDFLDREVKCIAAQIMFSALFSDAAGHDLQAGRVIERPEDRARVVGDDPASARLKQGGESW